MKFAVSSFFVLILGCQIPRALSQGGGGNQVITCTGVNTRFPSPSEGACLTSWENQRMATKTYPNDFEGILNKVDIYQCLSIGKRVIISNGIPDHSVTLQNRLGPCEVNWAVEIPLYPAKASRTEVPIRGMLAMSLNGVPAYGPQESDSLNAVEGMGVQGARFWYGHSGASLEWHVHNPQMGKETVTSSTLLGYAMDGFPIYGPLADDSVLDPCNGMTDGKGNYKYHVRTIEQVDGNLEYCNGVSPETNWNYILGCYNGDIKNSRVYDSRTYTLASDCFINELPASSTKDPPTQTPVEKPVGNAIPRGVNVIVMQPDDLHFFDEWSSPPNNPKTANKNINFPANGLPNIERLRLNGLQMLQAYTASPVCGTSRYSTLTGKYPSRALSNNRNNDPFDVSIPTTKLEGDDCSSENMAAEFQRNGYRTAMIGKWHLSKINKRSYTYENALNTVKGCGFGAVAGLYVENLSESADQFNSYSDGTFSHNMEWITQEALKVINEDSDQPFLLYFNPTVPHSSNDIGVALRDFSCRDTANGKLGVDPMIPGMTKDYGGCTGYRQSIFDRSTSENDYGPIWLDDSVGALLKALEDKEILDNTVFLFQIDHGMDPKSSLYEGGVRIPQFIHYPDAIRAGTKFDGPVSTIDISKTMFDFAGIVPSYSMDGVSWKDAIAEGSEQSFWKEERCLFFELERDRAARCGCFKYLNIYEQNDSSSTYTRGNQNDLSNDLENIFDLCDGSSEYVTDKTRNTEATNLLSSNQAKALEVGTELECHLTRTESIEFSSCNLNNVPDPASPTQSPDSNISNSDSFRPTALLFFCLASWVLILL